jgi:hypothetical protein
MDKMILTTLFIVVVIILVLVIGSGVFVLMAYGIGWVVNHLMGFDSFQATTLALAGIFVFISFVDRVVKALDAVSPYQSVSSEYDDDNDDDEDYDDDDDEDDIDDYEIIKDEETLNKLYAGIPRWRRPTRTVDFSNTEPDARCPCGSGRKYKNCHGTKQKKI